MAYNTLKGKVNFSNSTTGSIESMVDNYSAQSIAGVKTFTSIVSASTIHITSGGGFDLTASAISNITNDGDRRVVVSDGDGTATCFSNFVYNGTTLTASAFSGSAQALTAIPLEPYKVSGNLSASNIYFGNGLQNSSNKLAAQGGDGIAVGASGIAVDLATTGGLAHDVAKLKVSPNDATAKGSLSNNDIFLIADSDAGNATKKTLASTLATYMQSALTFPSPGGSDNQIQYKNGSNFAGSSNLVFDGSNTLTTVNVSASGHVSSSLFVGNGSGLTGITGVNASAVNQSIQFNSASTFSGSANLLFDFLSSTKALKVVGDLSSSNDLQIGRDATFGRNVSATGSIAAIGQISSSGHVSGTAFYGRGDTLDTAPINNYTNTRLVFCGATTNTLDTQNGLTWANPTLSVPGNISLTNITASGTSKIVGAATFSSTVKTTGSIVSYGGMRVSGSSYSYTLRDNSNNDMFKADISSGHGRVRVRDSGNNVRIELSGDGGEISGSGEASFGGVDIFHSGVKKAYLSSSGEISGSSAAIFGTVQASGSTIHGLAQFTGSLEVTGAGEHLLVLHAKDADNTREIVFRKDGTDAGSLYINSSEHMFLRSEVASKDIILRTNSSNPIRCFGANHRVGIGNKTTANAMLDVNGDTIVTGSLSVVGEISGSDEASLGGLDIFFGGTKRAYVSGSGVLSGSAVLATSGTFAVAHLSGGHGTELLRLSKGTADTREIVFENDGTDVGSIFMNAAESLIVKNESNNDDIILQVKPGGSATNALTVDGDNANIGIGTTTPKTKLDVRYSPTTLANDTGGGDVVLFGAGSLTAGKLYYLHTDGNWTEADADAPATGADQLLGIALGSDPGVDGVLIRGFFDAHTYLSNFTVGKAIYVSTTAGSMDCTAPAGSGDFVRVVGYCTSATNVIYFNPSATSIELE